MCIIWREQGGGASRFGCPASPADQHKGVLRARRGIDDPADALSIRFLDRGLDAWQWRRWIGMAGRQHVLRQCQHHRPRTTGQRRAKGAGHIFGDAIGTVDLCHPFGERAVHGPVIDLLERFAVALVGRHLPDEQDHRRRILKRHMDAGGRVGGARSTRDHGDARPAGEFAMGLGHHGRPAFLAGCHGVDVRIVKRIKGRAR